jgi:hypothetical protein
MKVYHAKKITIKFHHIVHVGALNNMYKMFSNPYVLKFI